MIYLLRLVSEGYNFGLIRLYLMWFEICKYMYMYIYIHTVYALYAMGPMWVTMLIFDMIFEWFDLINGFTDVWFLKSIARTKSHQAPHTQHTHIWSHMLLYLYKWYNMQTLWYIYICQETYRYKDYYIYMRTMMLYIRAVIYIYIYIYICVSVRACMW